MKAIFFAGRAVWVPVKHGGTVADYIGFESVTNKYLVCEVKEHTGESAPSSLLRRDQRDWMQTQPEGCRFVLIVDSNSNPVYAEMFEFKYAGSYKKGTGLYRV
jgi:hypothetical protein